MKKLNLKLSSLILTFATVLSVFPMRGFGAATFTNVNKKGKTGSVSIGEELALYAGGAVICGAALGTSIYKFWEWRSSENVTNPRNTNASPTNSSHTNSSPTNANFTNVQNLCFWHSFVQQMYSLDSFWSFIKNVDLKAVAPPTAKKIKAFRSLFDLMAKCGRIRMERSEAFATQILPPNVIGAHQDIHEIWISFISDIGTEYKRYYQGCTNIFELPIALGQMPLDLSSLLKGEVEFDPEPEAKREAVKGLLGDAELRKAYQDKFKSDFPSVPSDADNSVLNLIANDLGDVECVKNALQKLPNPGIDVSIIENQFVIFVNRTKYGGVANEKDSTKIDFGDGKTTFKGKQFDVTAVACHKGNPEHYYTYKKHGNNWYKYDDCCPGVLPVSWGDVKNDAETNCTMLTFTEIR